MLININTWAFDLRYLFSGLLKSLIVPKKGKVFKLAIIFAEIC